MSHIIITYPEIMKITSQTPFLSGEEGICYFMSDKILFKLYKGLRKRQVCYENLKSDDISFPIDLYFYENTGLIQGYTMKYLEGVKLFSGFKPTLLIEDLVKAYKRTQKVIEDYPDIYMDDLFLRNILYDYQKNRIHLIDTSNWYDKENAVYLNLNQFTMEFMKALCDRTLEFEKHPLFERKILWELYDMYVNQSGTKDLFLGFLLALQEEVSKEKEKVKTIGDLFLTK